jgi:S-adenosylmethionine hydrolase
MKGVILSICPSARLVDLTHDLPPQDVLGGALALESAIPFFPAGSVHLAVVDPGVGTERRALAIRSDGRYLVGPDNGLLTLALGSKAWTAVSLTAPEYRLPAVSRTFHGRDIFAPAAAHLAAGVPLERLGPPVADPVRLPVPGCHLDSGWLVGEVLEADRFGNLITSIPAARLEALPGRGPAVFELLGRSLGLVGSYADGGEGIPAVIVGSTGRLEVFVKAGSARDLLAARRGTLVRVRKAG